MLQGPTGLARDGKAQGAGMSVGVRFKFRTMLMHLCKWLTACALAMMFGVSEGVQQPAWSESALWRTHSDSAAASGTGLHVYAGRSDLPVLPALPGGMSIPLPPGMERKTRSTQAGTRPATSGVREGTGVYQGMVLIPSGPFEMGSPEGAGRPDEYPLHQVFIKNFYIAKHETTVKEYCRFLNEAGLKSKDGLPRVNLNCQHSPVRVSGQTFVPAKGMDNMPIVCVSWHGAADYARWAGGRLPTAAEWEKAAKVTTSAHPGDYLTVITRQAGVPVQIASPGIHGVTGMVGNVWEWTSDWYLEDSYARSATSNPTGPPLGVEKELRGGSWAAAVSSTRMANRHHAPPQGYFRTVGFRIVKD